MEDYAIYAEQALTIAKEWAVSPAAWSQVGLLIAAFIIAHFIARALKPRLVKLLTPAEGNTGIIANARLYLLLLVPMLLPALAYAATAAGESLTRSLFGSGAIIAFGKRAILFFAVRSFVRDILKDPFLRVVGKFVFIPLAALYAVGLLPLILEKLENTIVPLGNLSFSLLWLGKFCVVGAVIFWFGRWSNTKSQEFIETQEEMRPATRQLALKAAEIAIFGALFLVLMNIMGVSLTSLAVLGGAIGVGIGFGLQQIASNFISGIILLLEGQATVGDFVELDGGESGTIVKMTMRSTILETYDGKWIVVPNEHFITTRVVNYSDQGSANRYEAEFSVSYETDINTIPDIIEAAVAKHPDVLTEPFPPDCELRGFGESGVDFAVEFWVNGLDDGRHKYSSDVLFLIWNALRDNNIQIPYPHRVVELKQPLPSSEG